MSLYDHALGEKVTALIGEQVGGMVTGLYGIVQYIDDDGEQRIAVMCAPGQTFVVSQGLLTIAGAVADTELTTYVMDSMHLDPGDDSWRRPTHQGGASTRFCVPRRTLMKPSPLRPGAPAPLPHFA